MSWYRDQLESYLKTLDIKAERVLDIGGGANSVNDRVKSWEVKEYKIADNGLERPKEEWDYFFDLNDPDEYLIDKLKDSFDIIFCLEVMEYVNRPETAIKNILSLLKKGGKLYITFPFVYPLHNPKEGDFLRYTREGVKNLILGEGVSLMEMTDRIDRSGKLAEFYKADGMHCAGDSNITGFIVEATK